MTSDESDNGGLSKRGAHVLGFFNRCRCGHDYGLHDELNRCAVVDCGCRLFIPGSRGENAPPNGKRE